MSCEWDDYEWKDLPQNIQEAAMVLGYNGKVWDKDRKAAAESKHWNELNAEEQEAAGVLGYKQETWDELVESE